MASVAWGACCVFLLVVSGVSLAVTAKGTGTGPPTGRRPAAELNSQHLCSLLPNCTSWCSDCSDRLAENLFDLLDNCADWNNSPPSGYEYVHRCPRGSAYKVCICTTSDSSCKKCVYSDQNDLVCFSQENGDVHIWPGTQESLSSVLLEDVCPSCSCSTNKPTSTQPATTRPMKTGRIDERIPPKPNPTSMTTSAGTTGGTNTIIIVVPAVGGVLLTCVVIIICCYCLIRYRKKHTKKEQEYAYIDTQEMRTLRSQASMMNSQQMLSSQGTHPPCGHRQFNNEMYGLKTVGNGSTLSASPPELPGNHPPPSKPPPAPYQELSRDQGPAALNMAMVSGPCPHCRRMVSERSATAPLLDRPGGLDVEGAQNPYMALMKNNTCPTPGTPQGEPMCKCHARPLSECSSVTESVTSGRQSNPAQAPDVLSTTAEDSDQRPLSTSSNQQESPYYFKMEPSTNKETLLSPKSPQYFKLEDAETLPLDSEVSPMLSNPDSNGNEVDSKQVDSASTDSTRKSSSGSEKESYMGLHLQDSEKQPTLDSTVPVFESPKKLAVKTLSAGVEPEKLAQNGELFKSGSL